MDWVTQLQLSVPGVPVQQGSKTAMPLGRWEQGKFGKIFKPYFRKDGMPLTNVVDDNAKKLGPYRKLVQSVAEEAWWPRDPLSEPLSVTIEDVFPTLVSHHVAGKRERELKADAPLFKHTKPDLDKLERSVLDALTDAKVWEDDALVVELHGRKVFGLDPETRIWVQTIAPIEPVVAENQMVLL